MGPKKRTITINETATFLSLKLRSKEMQRGWCAECEMNVIWLELGAAMKLFGTIGLSKKRVVHLSDGRVCSRSLLNIKNIEN
jgi:hypothetical protein